MPSFPEKISRVFKTNRVADMQLLQKELDNRSARSIFRDLENEGYFSSFSHSGKYYTLKKIPNFNSAGLWFCQEIGFAKFGTLKNTVLHLINDSDAGKTHNELKEQLHLRVQNTLLTLVRSNKIIRRKTKEDYTYFSSKKDHAKKQILCREKNHSFSETTNYPDWIIIEIFASIIRVTATEKIDLSKIVSDLANKKIAATEDQIEQILKRFDLKKTQE